MPNNENNINAKINTLHELVLCLEDTLTQLVSLTLCTDDALDKSLVEDDIKIVSDIYNKYNGKLIKLGTHYILDNENALNDIDALAEDIRDIFKDIENV